MKTTRQRAEETLADVRRQVQNGSLVIRQMTDAERQRHPVRPRPPRRGR